MARIVVLNENLFEELLGFEGVVARKRKITACVENTAGVPLHYRTAIGTGTEVESGLIQPGFHFVIQPNGELHVQAGKASGGIGLVSTFDKFQVRDSAMDYPTAESKRAERNMLDLPMPTPEVVATALAQLAAMNPDVDLTSLVPVWYDAKGYVTAFRLPEGIDACHLAKLGWDGIQDYGPDHVFIYNHLSPSMYAIGKQMWMEEWYLPLTPQLTGEEMWAGVPRLNDDQLAKLELVPARDMPGVNVSGIEGRNLAVAFYCMRKGITLGAQRVEAEVTDFVRRRIVV